MFEIIGKIAVFFILFITIFLQYFIMSVGMVRKNNNRMENIIGWIPFLPFILMTIVLIYLIMESMWYKLNKWFEINLGWFFINGRKQEHWHRYLRKKYGKEK